MVSSAGVIEGGAVAPGGFSAGGIGAGGGTSGGGSPGRNVNPSPWTSPGAGGGPLTVGGCSGGASMPGASGGLTASRAAMSRRNLSTICLDQLTFGNPPFASMALLMMLSAVASAACGDGALPLR